MLEASKKTTTKVMIHITGTSVIDEEIVAKFNAYLDPDDRPVVTTTIINTDMFTQYAEDVQEDEQAFEEYVCESDKVAMTTEDEITETLTGNVSADNEETIIP